MFILCGGLGTRLRPVEARPKAVVPVAARPFVSYQLALLAAQGFARFHFLLGVGADAVREALPEVARVAGVPLDRFSMSQEREPLGTGGAVGSARERAAAWNLVLNADSFVDADLGALPTMAAAHGDEGCALLAVWQENRADYGGLALDPDDRVIRFLEKGGRDPGWINGGVYLLGRAVIDALPPGPSSLERETLPQLASAGRLWAVRAHGFFRDMGTPERLAAAQQEFVAVGERFALPTSPP